MGPRVLVAGIGNIFLGDDAFGVEVVNRLSAGPLPAGVDAIDFGIRGVHLAYELAGGRYHSVILVDAAPRGGAPGTIYVIEPDVSSTPADAARADAHSLTPESVLAWMARAGGAPCRITIVGCEPLSVEEFAEMSAPVAAAVDEAVRAVRELIAAAEEAVAPCA